MAKNQKTQLTQSVEGVTASNTAKRKVHPNTLANLKPFVKGVSGNPSGRPKKPITERLIERLATEDETLSRMIAAIITKAYSGDVAAFQAIADRVEGKVTDKLAVSQDEPTTDAERMERIKQLEAELGIASASVVN